MTHLFKTLLVCAGLILVVFNLHTLINLIPVRRNPMHKFTATHHDIYELHETNKGWELKVYGEEEKTYQYETLKYAALEANVFAGTVLNWEYAQPTLVSTATASELAVEYQVWALPGGACELRLNGKRGVSVGMRFNNAAEAMGEAHIQAGRNLAWHFDGEGTPGPIKEADSTTISELYVLATSACNTYRLHSYRVNDRLRFSLFPGQSQHEFTGPGFAMHAAEVLNMDSWLNGNGGDVYQPIIWIRTTQEN